MSMLRAAPLVLVLASALAACVSDDPIVDESECGGCDADADCVKPDTGPECRCREGMAGDGKSCDRVLDASACGGSCAMNAWCVEDDEGLARCRCPSGTSGDGTTCAQDLAPTACGGCDPHARCLAAGGGNQCVCDAGYWGDGKTCALAADCDDHGGACHPLASCAMQSGAPTCRCEWGFAGDGYSCVPPGGGHVRLSGQIDVKAVSGAGGCGGTTNRFAWALDLPLEKEGAAHRYVGHATSGVFDVVGEVVITDLRTGAFDVTLDLHAWSEDALCVGRAEYKFSTNRDSLAQPEPMPQPLEFFGVEREWWYSGNLDVTNTVTSTLKAAFRRP